VSKSVAHISFSSAGGAGSVASALVLAQRESGREAHFAHVIDSDLRSAPLATPLHTMAAGLDHYVIKAPGFDAPISLLRDALEGNLEDSISGAEILHIHGYNGALRVGDLGRLARGKRVVWTLHDMNPFTGACHYSLGCGRYSDSCSSCPAVGAFFRPLVEKALRGKIEAIAAIEDLKVVAPSPWLAEAARASKVFAGNTITVIPNPVTAIGPPASDGSAAPTEATHRAGFVATVIARNLSDPVKNVRGALDAFGAFRAMVPDASLHLIGSGGAEFQDDGVAILGALSPGEVASELQRSDALIVPSLAENAPLVIIEAAWAGCPALVNNVGGMPHMVKEVGHGAVFNTTGELVDTLHSLADKTLRDRQTARARLQAAARTLYSPPAVVAQYDELYD
jgi:glycosyltransferase involved in cell wall biosynthesis